MENQIFGILTIIICTIGYYFSFRYHKKDNYFVAILLLLVCGLVLRVYVSSDFFLHTWDERYHALVAKNFMQHSLKPTLYDNPLLPYDYKNWMANHIWVHKQPLPLWFMAGSMWLFGINEFALRLPSILLTTIGIFLTFFIGKYFFSRKTGFLAAFFYSINGLIIELTAGRVATDHIDIFFLFFIELAVFFSIVLVQKKKLIYTVLLGISMGLAILSKWLPALIVLPIWLLIAYDSGKFKIKEIIFHSLVSLFVSVLIFLPWQIYIFKSFPLEAQWETSFNLKHFTEVIEDRTGPFYYFFDKIRVNYGELIYLPLFWFFWKVTRKQIDYKSIAICIWFLVPFFIFSIAKTKMQAYLLFTAPALFMITAEYWYMLSVYKENCKFKWFYNLILILLIALPVRYAIERIKPFEKLDRKPQWVVKLKKLNDKKIENGVLFNYEKPIEAMFYTNLTVYSEIPDKKLINELIAKGFYVIINDNGKIPEDVKNIKGIEFIELNIN